MTTVAIPGRWPLGHLKLTPWRDALWIECEIVDPPSSRGRRIHVYVNPDDVTELLLAVRDAARLARMPDVEHAETYPTVATPTIFDP